MECALALAVVVALSGLSCEAPPVEEPVVAEEAEPSGNDAESGYFLSDDEVLPAYRDPSGHRAMPPSTPGDWRSGPGLRELRQSFLDYKASRPVRATEVRTTIVLQPLGDLDARGKAELRLLAEYTRVFFGCPVELRDPIALPTRDRRTRTSGLRQWQQYRTRRIMRDVLLRRIPQHAICYLGITLEDIYPGERWNYVFGEAYLTQRVGVYSLARYRATFWGEPTTAASRRRAFRRSCSVLSHEAGHMFGMDHCAEFACLMNGNNSLDELDRTPVWLCPICASKLTWNRGFDPAERYRGLGAFFEKAELPAIAKWYRLRAALIDAMARGR